MRLFGFYIYKEKPGVISKGPCWVCFYGYWGHFCGGFWELIWNVITEYKHERHIIGYEHTWQLSTLHLSFLSQA